MRQKQDFIHLADPASRSFDVLEEFHSFSLQNSEKEDHQRILVFNDNEMVKFLQSTSSWLADGTWESRRKTYYLPYTVHVQGHGMAPVYVHAIPPNSTGSTHKKFLDFPLGILPNADSIEYLIDIELADKKTIKIALPNAIIEGCFFHT